MTSKLIPDRIILVIGTAPEPEAGLLEHGSKTTPEPNRARSCDALVELVGHALVGGRVATGDHCDHRREDPQRNRDDERDQAVPLRAGHRSHLVALTIDVLVHTTQVLDLGLVDQEQDDAERDAGVTIRAPALTRENPCVLGIYDNCCRSSWARCTGSRSPNWEICRRQENPSASTGVSAAALASTGMNDCSAHATDTS